MIKNRLMHLSNIALCVVLFFAAAQISFAAPCPVTTGFESPDYLLGDLDGQQGWLATDTVNVQNSTVLFGSQAVEITSNSQTVYESGSSSEVIWFEVQCLPTAGTEYPELPMEAGASCVLFFHATGGITCLDGDGDGSGNWYSTGIMVTEWTRLAIRQDFAAHTWDLYVNGVEKFSGLGNAYNTTAFENMEFNAGSAGPMLLDEMHIGTDAAIPPIITAISDDTTMQGDPYSLSPSLSQMSTFDATWSLQGSPPAGMTINPTTGQIDWDSATAADSPYTITLRCSSSTGFDEESYILNVVIESTAITQWTLY